MAHPDGLLGLCGSDESQLVFMALLKDTGGLFNVRTGDLLVTVCMSGAFMMAANAMHEEYNRQTALPMKTQYSTTVISGLCVLVFAWSVALWDCGKCSFSHYTVNLLL